MMSEERAINMDIQSNLEIANHLLKNKIKML